MPAEITEFVTVQSGTAHLLAACMHPDNWLMWYIQVSQFVWRVFATYFKLQDFGYL